MTWDWGVFLQDDGGGRTYLEWMFEAWGWTLSVAACAWLVAMLFGLGVGVLRTLPNNPVLSRLANAWVELFRNIPLLVQIFLWYFVLPKLIPPMQQFPGFLLVVLGLGFFTSARIAEQVRAGIGALPRGQRYAAMAMGFTTWQSYRYVLLPMAYRIIWPPLTSESMNLLKNSSVAFAVSIAELTMFAMQAQEETSRGIEIYLAVTGLYAFSALVINRVLAWVERRLRVPGFIAAGATGGTWPLPGAGRGFSSCSRSSARPMIVAPSLAKFSLPPVWSKCRWLMTRVCTWPIFTPWQVNEPWPTPCTRRYAVYYNDFQVQDNRPTTATVVYEDPIGTVYDVGLCSDDINAVWD
mgnify:CR=1 FL=1